MEHLDSSGSPAKLKFGYDIMKNHAISEFRILQTMTIYISGQTSHTYDQLPLCVHQNFHLSMITKKLKTTNKTYTMVEVVITNTTLDDQEKKYVINTVINLTIAR